MTKFTRTPLSVGVVYRQDGEILPVLIIYGGKKFQVDKILDKRKRAPLTVGSVAPVEYTVLVAGETKKIYFEEDTGKWFSVKASRK